MFILVIIDYLSYNLFPKDILTFIILFGFLIVGVWFYIVSILTILLKNIRKKISDFLEIILFIIDVVFFVIIFNLELVMIVFLHWGPPSPG